MVVAGTDSGQPAASTALRPTLNACSPTWETQPMMTSSTREGSRLLREAIARNASDARSTGCQFFSFPLRLPPGVRTASTMTATGIGVPFVVGDLVTARILDGPWEYRHGREHDAQGHGPMARRRGNAHHRGDWRVVRRLRR